MAQWVDMEAEKSRTERMSVRDHPIWGWFGTSYLSESKNRLEAITKVKNPPY